MGEVHLPALVTIATIGGAEAAYPVEGERRAPSKLAGHCRPKGDHQGTGCKGDEADRESDEPKEEMGKLTVFEKHMLASLDRRDQATDRRDRGLSTLPPRHPDVSR